MTFSVRIKAHINDSEYLFRKNYETREEFQTFSNCCADRKCIGTFEATLITVRTDTSKNFQSDFFLPTFMHLASKTQSVAEKIFYLIADICTFAIRAITLIPRLIQNMQHQKQNHPLYTYLQQNGVNLENLGLDHVYVEREWTEDASAPDARKTQFFSARTIKFLELPQDELDNDSLKSEWITSTV
jgi:hypothetical protein